MATMRLTRDFKEFLQLLNSARIEYLLIGGYAVTYYGYPRATADMDIWVAVNPANAQRLTDVLVQFGLPRESVSPELFLKEKQVVRMGVPPMRLELLTSVSGVDFASCYQRRHLDVIDGVEVAIISLDDLKANKRAAKRLKDLNDLEHLS